MEEYEETETCVKYATPQIGTNKMITESGMKSTPSSTRKGPPSRLIIENSSMQNSIPVKSANKDATPKTVDKEDPVKRSILVQKYRSRFLNTLIKDCQNRGLQCSGTKMDLVDRLVDDDMRKIVSGKQDSVRDIRHRNTTLKGVDKGVSITQVVSRLGYTDLPSEPLSVVSSMKDKFNQFEMEMPPPPSADAVLVKPRIQPNPDGDTDSRIRQPYSPEAISLHTLKPSPHVKSAVSPAPPHNKEPTSINSPSVTSTITAHRVSPPAHAPVSPRVPVPPVSSFLTPIKPSSPAPSPPVQVATAHPPATVQTAESGTVENTEDGDNELF